MESTESSSTSPIQTAVTHSEVYEWWYIAAGEEVAVVHSKTYLHYKLITVTQHCQDTKSSPEYYLMNVV
jgi:hypothetical protein